MTVQAAARPLLEVARDLELSPADLMPARATYGAGEVLWTKEADRALAQIETMHVAGSDDPVRLGRPEEFDITVRDVILAAGDVVPLLGDILRMPSLPAVPPAERMNLVNGEAVGVSAPLAPQTHIYGNMGPHVKTTIDLPDDLLIAAKKKAAESRTTLRVLFERGLRHVLAERRSAGTRRSTPRIRWVTVRGGLPPGLDVADRTKMHDWIRRQR